MEFIKKGRTYIVVTVSGGKTSARQAIWMTLNKDRVADYLGVPIAAIEYIYVFCNTGREHNETLDFVNRIDKTYFGGKVIWLEALIHHVKGKGTTHRITDYEHAHRNDEFKTRRDTHPFVQYVSKYGVPNQSFKSCTRELKLRPQESFMRSLGFKTGEKSRNYYTAIGFRTDEAHRRSNPEESKKMKVIYPMLDIELMDKEDIEIFWEDRKERLTIPPWQGNCLTCFKKSQNKLNLVHIESPEAFEFNRWIEKEFPLVGAEFDKGKSDTPRKQFRENRNTDELIAVFKPADEVRYIKNFVHDIPGSCTEECDFSYAFFNEDLK